MKTMYVAVRITDPDETVDILNVTENFDDASWTIKEDLKSHLMKWCNRSERDIWLEITHSDYSDQESDDYRYYPYANNPLGVPFIYKNCPAEDGASFAVARLKAGSTEIVWRVEPFDKVVHHSSYIVTDYSKSSTTAYTSYSEAFNSIYYLAKKKLAKYLSDTIGTEWLINGIMEDALSANGIAIKVYDVSKKSPIIGVTVDKDVGCISIMGKTRSNEGICEIWTIKSYTKEVERDI